MGSHVGLARDRCCIALLVINLGESSSCHVQIGPQSQGGFVLLASQIELSGRGKQVTQVRVAGRLAV